MRTLSDTLLAAQKKADTLPYAEAKVYELDQGIRRLSWERLYEGSEPDNHHGIAFDDQGSMHRIRLDTGRDEKKLIGQDDQTISGTVFKDYHWSDKFTATASGQLDTFRLKCSASGNVKLAIYADDSGSPGTLLNALNTGQYVTSGWNTIPFPATTITNGTTYWLSFISDANVVGRWANTPNTKKYKSIAYAGFTFPDPAGSFDGDINNYPDIIAVWQAATSDTRLYYQKIKDPYPPDLPSFPLSFPIPLLFHFSDWQLIADNCQGPCAIAACGAKIYIFYRKTDNTVRKRYSHNYGDTWTDAELVAYADVLSMAATWWVGSNPESPTPIVVCFALQASELKAIVLDSSDQSSSQHTKTFSGGGASHYLDNSLGIGATYRPNHCEIVFAARELSTSPNSPYPYDAYHLWRTELDSDYNFLAIQSFLTVPDGEGTTHQYPDCHIPCSAGACPLPYENTRILAVEKFTGTTAYTRPLISHAVRGSDFSSMAFTEPKPLLNISSSYGLRLQSTADYWWMERPDGVWRAPRPLGDPTDLTNDILSLRQRCEGLSSPDALVIILDNSQGQYSNPAAQGLVPRSEVVLKLGYKTTEGAEAVEVDRYWIDAWHFEHRTPNVSTLTLFCLDGWGLAAKWAARFQMRWAATKTVWEIIQEIICRWGIDLTQPAGVPQSTAINNFYPDFTIPPGTPGDTALRRVLSFVPDAIIFDGYQAWTKDLEANEESSYSYSTNPGDHVILSGRYREGSPLSRARAIGRAEDDSPIIAETLNFELLELGIDILSTDYDPNLTTTTRTQERADAILRTESLRAKGGKITIPTNCGQELYDVITLTDDRCGISNEKYRVAAIQTTYELAVAAYFQRLSLHAP